MRRTRALSVTALFLAAGCTSGPAVVTGAGPDDLLKLRAGPGLAYSIIMGLPDGTELTRQDCVTELGQRWCRVTLADAPGVTGYVSADYLSER